MNLEKKDAATGKNQIDCPPRHSSRCADYHIGGHVKKQLEFESKKIVNVPKGSHMNALSIRKEEQSLELSIIEQVVMQGDLSKLNPEQRVTYYRKVCESAGLNPFTNPFAYILLNGKLTLYAKKDCTEQLRKLNGVSIEGLDDKLMDDLYIVKAKAKDKTGRTDESTGAVVIGNLKGEARANAIMKAETKAKRRVTLSICGMGWTDESEIDSIPNAAPVDVDLSTGEIKTEIKPVPKKPQGPKFSSSQADELDMILSECDEKYKKWVFDYMKKQYQTDDLLELPAELFDRMKSAAMKNAEQTFNENKRIQEEQEMIVMEVE